MAAYESGREIVDDILFRAGEATTQTDWASKALDYLNRSYRTLCAGSSEFLPEYVDDWFWLRGIEKLTLEPAILAGTVNVTANSTSIIFSSAPADSVVGWRIRVGDHPELFSIATHTAGAAAATLDSPYTGSSASASAYKLMKVIYTLASNVQALISPMIGYRNNPRIMGVTPERMDDIFPFADLQPGVPEAFALEDLATVRFSHGGRIDGQKMRIEYRFRKVAVDLAYALNSIPLVPLEYRAVLSDMALTYVWLDKNDDRSNATALGARTGLAAMWKENRRKLARMGSGTIGHIYPRQGGAFVRRGPLRTASGLIIG